MQQVRVNVIADTWVIGIIVGIVQFAAKVTIPPYDVVRLG